ncbi:MAG: chromate transporter [Clostridia bacterium]
MIYLNLFIEFFKIGLFAIGGGLATIPFLQRLGEDTGWFDQSLISDMIAISESTPGPIGINMATYVGYNVAGVLGGIVATFGEILPSIIIVILFSKSLEKLTGNTYVKDAFYGMRPAVTGLIGAACYSLINISMLNLTLFKETMSFFDLVDLKKVALFAVMYVAIIKYKKHPVFYIAISALIGIILKF